MSILRTEVLPFKATAFKDGDFINISEADLHGKWSVVFFYPADFTFVCPTELEDLAEHYEEFQKRGVEIYSVSTDTHFTHMAWHGSSPAVGKVRFPMVGDPTGVICRNFGVMIEEAGLAERGTFVINPEGKIVACEIHDGGIGRDAAELLRKPLSTLQPTPVKSARLAGVRVLKRSSLLQNWLANFNLTLSQSVV